MLNKLLQFKKYKTQKTNLFLIYTLGKVGSTTVYKTLLNESPFNNVFHTHFLSEYYLSEILPNTNHTWNIDNGRKILEIIQQNKSKQIKIITLVRDPISRLISNFFQNHIDYIENDPSTLTKDELINKIIETADFEYVFNWFDKEFKNYTNIDIYNQVFDKEKGYSLYSINNYDILLIKLESLTNCYNEAFYDFCSLNIKNLSNENVEETNNYKSVKKDIKFNKKYLNDVYNSKFVKHFYSTNEIEKFISKWSK